MNLTPLSLNAKMNATLRARRSSFAMISFALRACMRNRLGELGPVVALSALNLDVLRENPSIFDVGFNTGALRFEAETTAALQPRKPFSK
jgi:hypothetical protein